MRLKWNTQGALLALGLVVTAGPSVSYINVVLNSGMRWLVLLVLLISLLLTRNLFTGLRGYAQILLLSLLALAVLSTIWSPVPQLTGVKAITFSIVAIAYSSAGAFWLRHSQRKNALNVFWPLAVLTLIAGFGGVVNTNAQVQMNESITLYRGLTFNSNFLGMLILATLPLPLWRMSHSNIAQRERWFYYGLLAVLLYLLITTFARASFAASAILVLFYFFGRGVGRLTLLLVGSLVVVVMMTTFFPAPAAEIMERYVYKGADATVSVLASREFTWAASYDAAVQGGIFGLGYGVSFGFDDYSLSLGATEYGREKANVFLAIVEEVGILGLVLFLGMLLSLILRGFAAITVARDKEDRLLLFLLVGYIVALTVHAQFEAWMFSPGGALSPVFWAAIGMLTRLSLEVSGAWSAKVTARRQALNGLPVAARRVQSTERMPNA